MNTRELGIGNGRVFRRQPPSSDIVRFVAPEPEAAVRRLEGTGAEALIESGGRLLREARERRSPFQPLPAPTGSAPYRMALSSVLSMVDMAQIEASGKLVFHTVGDTGGVASGRTVAGLRQVPVVDSMKADFDRPNPADVPAFFLHLGDVVYFKGEAENYFPQFYDPYEFYPAPIFAIPGNHDAQYSRDASSLEAFVRNFCSSQPSVSPDAQDVARDTMTQPNVYFTLQTPLATIVGLYSNVPEGGEIRDEQLDWFTEELRAAPTNRALITAVHHPLFSADTHHSGSAAMIRAFRHAMSESERTPDLILTAHVHNYQRYTWEVDDRQIPVIVAGAGGYPNLHKLARPNGQRIRTPFRPSGSVATLESYVDNRHGFLRIEVTADRVSGKYYAVPWDGDDDRGERTDLFHLDLHSHRLVVD